MKKLAKFLNSVKKEMKKVRWPKKNEISTYGTVTVLFVLTFAAFFGIVYVVISRIKTLVG